MRHRYFGRLAGRYERFERTIGVATVLLSSATAATVFGLFTLGAEVLALGAAALAAVGSTLRFGGLSRRNAEFSVTWGTLHADHENLWTELEAGHITHGDVLAALAGLRRRAEDIDRQTTGDPVYRKILSECLDQAEAQADAVATAQ